MKHTRSRGERGGGRGSAFPEAILTVFLLFLVALMGAPLLTHGTRLFFLNRTRVEMGRQARDLLSHLVRNIRQARSASFVIDQIEGQPYYSRIRFQRTDGALIVFAQDGDAVKETVNGHPRDVAADVRFLTFFFPRSDDMTVVSVSMTLEKTTDRGRNRVLHVVSDKVRVLD